MNGLFGGGDGTINNPYLVEDAADLHIGVRNKASEGIAYYFKQTEDISLDEYGSIIIRYMSGPEQVIRMYNGDVCSLYIDGNHVADVIVREGEYDGWTPINLNNCSYDGNNKLIMNMTMTYRNDVAGLFSFVTNGGEIKNIVLENCKIDMFNKPSKNDNYIGGLVGLALENTKILNCTVIGNITTSIGTSYTGYFGGVVGRCLGELSNCTFKGDMNTSHRYTGGVVGYYESNTTITKCKAIGNIVTSGESLRRANRVGGIAGASEADIEQSIFSGNIRGYLNRAGSIVGLGKGLYECAAYITMYSIRSRYVSTETIGGLAGELTGSVINCYSIGSIDGNNYTGRAAGLVGIIEGIIESSYALCDINGFSSRDAITASDGVGEYVFTNKTYVANYRRIKTYVANYRRIKTEDELRDINTYSGYAKLYQLENEPTNNFGNNGDVVLLPTKEERIVLDKDGYTIQVDVRDFTSFIKSNDVWNKTVVYDITEYYAPGIGTHLEDILNQLDKQNYYLYKYNQWVTGVGETNKSSYVYLNSMVRLNIDMVAYWRWVDVGENRFSPIYDSAYGIRIGKREDNNILSYREAVPGCLNSNNDNEFDFFNIWDIFSDVNNGFPILRNIDYEGILEMYLGIIKVQASNELVTIPFYNVTDEGNRLTVSTPKGLAEIKLVDINDTKASPVRMMTANGIKSWSK